MRTPAKRRKRRVCSVCHDSIPRGEYERHIMTEHPYHFPFIFPEKSEQQTKRAGSTMQASTPPLHRRAGNALPSLDAKSGTKQRARSPQQREAQGSLPFVESRLGVTAKYEMGKANVCPVCRAAVGATQLRNHIVNECARWARYYFPDANVINLRNRKLERDK